MIMEFISKIMSIFAITVIHLTPYQTDKVDMINFALNSWEMDLHKLHIVETRPDTEDVFIVFSNGDCDAIPNLTLTENSFCKKNWGLPEGKNYIASCMNSVYPNGIISGSLIVIWQDRQLNLSKKEKIKTFIHEIGHCLGLSHSKDTKNIMYESITEDSFYPSEIERNTVRYLYNFTGFDEAMMDVLYFNDYGKILRHRDIPKFYTTLENLNL